MLRSLPHHCYPAPAAPHQRQRAPAASVASATLARPRHQQFQRHFCARSIRSSSSTIIIKNKRADRGATPHAAHTLSGISLGTRHLATRQVGTRQLGTSATRHTAVRHLHSFGICTRHSARRHSANRKLGTSATRHTAIRHLHSALEVAVVAVAVADVAVRPPSRLGGSLVSFPPATPGALLRSLSPPATSLPQQLAIGQHQSATRQSTITPVRLPACSINKPASALLAPMRLTLSRCSQSHRPGVSPARPAHMRLPEPISVGTCRHQRRLRPAALVSLTTTNVLASTAAGGRARFARLSPPHDTTTCPASAVPHQRSRPTVHRNFRCHRTAGTRAAFHASAAPAALLAASAAGVLAASILATADQLACSSIDSARTASTASHRCLRPPRHRASQRRHSRQPRVIGDQRTPNSVSLTYQRISVSAYLRHISVSAYQRINVSASQHRRPTVCVAASTSQRQSRSVRVAISASQRQRCSVSVAISASQCQRRSVSVAVSASQCQRRSVSVAISALLATPDTPRLTLCPQVGRAAAASFPPRPARPLSASNFDCASALVDVHTGTPARALPRAPALTRLLVHMRPVGSGSRRRLRGRSRRGSRRRISVSAYQRTSVSAYQPSAICH